MFYTDEETVPRTQDEKNELIRANPLFVDVAATVPKLTASEFTRAYRAALPTPSVNLANLTLEKALEPEIDALTPAEAYAEYVEYVAGIVHAGRQIHPSGDADGYLDSRFEADDYGIARFSVLRSRLWAERDRLNEVVFPMTDFERQSEFHGRPDDDDAPEHLF